jgi:hypothetical protein
MFILLNGLDGYEVNVPTAMTLMSKARTAQAADAMSRIIMITLYA